MNGIRVFAFWASCLVLAVVSVGPVAAFDLKPAYYSVKGTRLQSGVILEEMNVEYATYGMPKVDDNGDINNAVVFCHGWSGNYSQINLFKGIVGPGKPLDPD